MRLFVAAEIASALRARAQALIERLAAPGRRSGPGPRVGWVAPERMHLTLRYLGAFDAGRLETLCGRLASCAAQAAPFRVEVGGLGVYPGWRRPRVIKLAVREGDGALAALAASLERAAVALGLPAQTRPFDAHLTLGRIRGGPTGELVDRLRGHESVTLGAQPVAQVVLFESALADGLRYTPHARFDLGG